MQLVIRYAPIGVFGVLLAMFAVFEPFSCGVGWGPVAVPGLLEALAVPVLAWIVASTVFCVLAIRWESPAMTVISSCAIVTLALPALVPASIIIGTEFDKRGYGLGVLASIGVAYGLLIVAAIVSRRVRVKESSQA